MKTTVNYDKYPYIPVTDDPKDCAVGWPSITRLIEAQASMIQKQRKLIVLECYQGVFEEDIRSAFADRFSGALMIHSGDAMYPEDHINKMLYPDITDDELFGYLTRYEIDCFFDDTGVAELRRKIAAQTGIIIVYGTGAGYIAGEEADMLIYADMARWEIQSRFRKNEVSNIGVSNYAERALLQYKRAFFVDWKICDRWKKKRLHQIDYILDTNDRDAPKMITGKLMIKGLRRALEQPFRVVPFFDPGPWGGQWMKNVCDLDKTASNYAWCFDCVPEENSLLLGFGDVRLEIPSVNLVYAFPRQLLGDAVYGRFGDEFPIRFDFLDTMDGGNLSLQVHPLTEYIQEKFGMRYTQDESYYILDAKDDAVVYLGLKDDAEPDQIIAKLKESQVSGSFDAAKYIGMYPVRKHDHVLIPAGTVHCSGKNSMVLEISATPFIFTFKLWDWGRLGLDGRPRPINIGHGAQVIQWNRTESWVKRELINRISIVDEDKRAGWIEERTGLHEQEFIETRRHWFTGKMLHQNNHGVNVLNLIEGTAVLVESPSGQFAPYVVHYAETFIIPANIKEYTITPHGDAVGTKCGTVKAFVRHHA